MRGYRQPGREWPARWQPMRVDGAPGMEPGRRPRAGRRRADPQGRSGAERGSASLYVLAVGLLLVGAGVIGASIGAAHVGRQRAGVAADLGALGGAARVVEGPGAACSRAAELVAANGGRLTSCVVQGLDLLVTAEVHVAPLRRTATATARAGPVESEWEEVVVST